MPIRARVDLLSTGIRIPVYVDVGNDIGSYVKDANAVVTTLVKLPRGYTLEWNGQHKYMDR